MQLVHKPLSLLCSLASGTNTLRARSATTRRSLRCVLAAGLLTALPVSADEVVTVSSLKELAHVAATDGSQVRMEPGLYRMADYLTEEVLDAIRASVPESDGRPTVPMFTFSGNDNTFDFEGVTIEIQNDLYRHLPHGYRRLIYIGGNNNTFKNLTITHSGPNEGSHGNTLAIFGEDNTLEAASLYIYGSRPWGYGDLLGKGGPNLVGLAKQSGIQIVGDRTTLRRCRVISRAFGHCYYIQHGANNVLLEDCYAEGVMRSTTDMMSETSGPAYDLGFRSVFKNRDGRFWMVPGYTKSLVEDGFRTYGGVGQVTLRNCRAVNTRAGFEIGGDTADTPTVIEGGGAFGCERGYLIGGNVVVRDSRGDVAHGPLLYLRGGRDSDVELELVRSEPRSMVHALATIAGSGHRVRLHTHEPFKPGVALPIMLGYGMPAHAEMASPILPARAEGVTLINEIPHMPIFLSDDVEDLDVQSEGRVIRDSEPQRGEWH